MCGLAGFWGAPRRAPAGMERLARHLCGSLLHRGPNDGGVWCDPAAGIALGHRRLSVLDLSPLGHQPMASACGRFVIVFNGEIYNHQTLREVLDRLGHGFRGGSDTETMLAALAEWGVEEAIGRFNGMFAAAVWDRKERRLHLARDRAGEKPLYYTRCRDLFLFGSEIKALRAHPSFDAEIDRDALALYLRHGYVPAPYSIYRGVFKLPAGTILTVREPKEDNAPRPYWSLDQVVAAGLERPFPGGEQEAASELERLLTDAVRLRMAADVPVGAFLSGGIDSSTVVALMQTLSSRPVRTFTIGSCDEGYNEARQASAVARHLGADHTELYVTPADARAVIPRLPAIYDEPFADSSQIPTFLVSELARRRVTVALSGDAGDELFGGYTRYSWATGIWRRSHRVPPVLRRLAARLLTAVSVPSWDDLLGPITPLLPAVLRQRNPGDKIHKLAGVLGASTRQSLYLGLVSQWREPAGMVERAEELSTPLTDPHQWLRPLDFERQMMYIDANTYLPDDILVKLDRASMAVSLEARVPLLDHRLIEFAASLPTRFLIRRGEGKWILRQVLYRHVPRALIDRPKTGFAIPIGAWLRGELRPWAEELLAERRLREEGFFRPEPIRRKWSGHLEGGRNWQHDLWNVLMFESWLEEARRSWAVPAALAVYQ
ncbi:MAG: asparagine synthase (glutamine-hydrolyzing) [Acidobacteria bacterium]|nr:asparagine synthase (glutamine-hydrolyzing) [Acidobacteriota bacterium]